MPRKSFDKHRIKKPRPNGIHGTGPVNHVNAPLGKLGSCPGVPGNLGDKKDDKGVYNQEQP